MKVHGKNRRDDRQMLKQIQDVIKFILIYAGVCASEETEVWWSVCVGGGGEGGRGEVRGETYRKRVSEGNIVKTLVSKRSA